MNRLPTVEGVLSNGHMAEWKECDLETLDLCDTEEGSLLLSTSASSSVNGHTGCLERL